MSVVVRTQLVTNPKSAITATGYSAVQGTGGTATGARNAGTGWTGIAGFLRVTWTVATSAVSGGGSYLQTGLAAATQYSWAMVVRSSKTQNVTLSAQYQNSSSTNVGSAFASAATALVANVWSAPIPINGATSGAAVDRVVITAAATAGTGVNWANGDTFDIGFVFGVQGATIGTVFDGDTASTTGLPSNLVYAWTGSANASTSTETKRTVALTTSAIALSNGCPGLQVTIQDAGTLGTYATSLTRLCEGYTVNTPGAVTVNLNDAAVVNDYAAPLDGRTVTYNLMYQGQSVASVSATLASAYAWIQDPLRPDLSIPIKVAGNNPGFLTMDGDALAKVVYPNGSSTITIAGSSYPVAMGGQPQQATAVPVIVWTDDQTTADAFRALKLGAPVLLLRPLQSMDPLPALSYMIAAMTEEQKTLRYGGTQTAWTITGDIVAAVQAAITSGYVTYQNVQDLITSSNTYAQVQTKSAAKTYLDWQKNPQIWSTL